MKFSFLRKLHSSNPNYSELVLWEKIFSNWINLCHKLGCIPVLYDEATGKFGITTNEIICYSWFLRLILLLLDNLYVIFQFQNVTPATVDDEEFMNFYFH